MKIKLILTRSSFRLKAEININSDNHIHIFQAISENLKFVVTCGFCFKFLNNHPQRKIFPVQVLSRAWDAGRRKDLHLLHARRGRWLVKRCRLSSKRETTLEGSCRQFPLSDCLTRFAARHIGSVTILNITITGTLCARARVLPRGYEIPAHTCPGYTSLYCAYTIERLAQYARLATVYCPRAREFLTPTRAVIYDPRNEIWQE